MNKKNNESILESDLILVHIENKPSFFARVEKIIPDIKKGWWRVELLILQIPLVVATWILDNEQIRGADFTMSGTPIRIEKVIAPSLPPEIKPVTEHHENEQPQKQARIVSLNPNSDK